MSVLSRGSTGDEVEWLQTWLRQLTFYQGPIDGDFGPGTEQALIAYRDWRGYGHGEDADDDLQTTLATDAEQHAAATEEARVEDDPNASVRQAVLAAAWGEIGLVRAKEAGGVDETGQQTRYGWERLTEYFDVAAPGVWSDDVVKYLKPGLPSWCGIFALWALKTGGASVGDWGMGTGIPGIRQVRDPKPGDIGYLEQNQHYCLIHSVDGDTVYSVDGNTVGDDTGGGEVNDRTRNRGDYLGFFTVFD
jgi:putative peptidoglycan binding protein